MPYDRLRRIARRPLERELCCVPLVVRHRAARFRDGEPTHNNPYSQSAWLPVELALMTDRL